jgi:hypothetical protein
MIISQMLRNSIRRRRCGMDCELPKKLISYVSRFGEHSSATLMIIFWSASVLRKDQQSTLESRICASLYA